MQTNRNWSVRWFRFFIWFVYFGTLRCIETFKCIPRIGFNAKMDVFSSDNIWLVCLNCKNRIVCYLFVFLSAVSITLSFLAFVRLLCFSHVSCYQLVRSWIPFIRLLLPPAAVAATALCIWFFCFVTSFSALLVPRMAETFDIPKCFTLKHFNDLTLMKWEETKTLALIYTNSLNILNVLQQKVICNHYWNADNLPFSWCTVQYFCFCFVLFVSDKHQLEKRMSKE